VKRSPAMVLSVILAAGWMSAALARQATSAPQSSKAAPAKSADQPRRFMVTDSWSDSPRGKLANQVQWLKADGARFAALALPSNKAGPAKAVLIVADLGQSPDTALAGRLRRSLPDSGWFTLSIPLPEPPLEAGPSAPGQADTTSAPDSPGTKTSAPEKSPPASAGSSVTIDLASAQAPAKKAAHKDFMDTAVKRVAAAVSYLQGAGYKRLALVGVGHGADVLMHAVADGSQNLNGPGSGLIWIRAVFTGPEEKDMGKLLGNRFSAPILDLVDADALRNDYRERAGSLARAGIGHYSQQRMPLGGPFGTLDSDAVVSRVRSWLNANFGPSSR